MGRVRVVIEATRSRRGGHLARSAAVLVAGPGRVEVVRPRAQAGGARGTYSKGRAVEAYVEVPEGWVLVYVRLVRPPSGRVVGRITVYNDSGTPVLEAKYERRKVRRSRGDASYGWAVEEAFRALGIDAHVRRYNWSTGPSANPL